MIDFIERFVRQDRFTIQQLNCLMINLSYETEVESIYVRRTINPLKLRDKRVNPSPYNSGVARGRRGRAPPAHRQFLPVHPMKKNTDR